MKKYFLVPLFFIFWCVSALFREPSELIPVAAAAAILCLISLPRRRVLWLCAAAAVAVCVSVYNVQFLLRCVPALLLAFARGKAEREGTSGTKKSNARPEGVYTAVIFVFLIALAGLISDIVSAARVPRANVPGRFYWVLFGIVLFFAGSVVAGGRAVAVPKSKMRAADRILRGSFLLIYICGGVCALCAAVGCLMNERADMYCTAFSWLIFLAVPAANGDPVLSDASARLRGAAEKLFPVSE